jgi:hypothetical protein
MLINIRFEVISLSGEPRSSRKCEDIAAERPFAFSVSRSTFENIPITIEGCDLWMKFTISLPASCFGSNRSECRVTAQITVTLRMLCAEHYCLPNGKRTRGILIRTLSLREGQPLGTMADPPLHGYRINLRSLPDTTTSRHHENWWEFG